MQPSLCTRFNQPNAAVVTQFKPVKHNSVVGLISQQKTTQNKMSAGDMKYRCSTLWQ